LLNLSAFPGYDHYGSWFLLGLEKNENAQLKGKEIKP
jgi:hypothetical protein